MSNEPMPQEPLSHLMAKAPVVVASRSAAWPEPVPLAAADLLPFPVHLLPGDLRAFVVAVAEATETPVEMAALIVLATIAAVVGKRFEIQLWREHAEPLGLMVMVIMEPGNRKTPVFKQALAPLAAWERRQADQLGPAIDEAALERDLGLVALRELEKKARFAAPEERRELAKQIAQERRSLPAPVVVPRLYTSDVTPEKLATLLADHGERMAVFSDEGGFLGTLAGRYQRGMPNLDVVLQGYSGSSVIVDRLGRAPIVLRSPVLTIALTPQPSVLQAIDASFVGRGLMDRFLYAVPPSHVGFRKLENRAIPRDVRMAHDAMMESLLALPSDIGANGSARPLTLTLSPGAAEEFGQFAGLVEEAMRPGASLEFAKGWASKLPGNVGRVAGLLHVAQHAYGAPDTEAVSVETMNAAIAFGAALIPHAKSAYGLIGADTAIGAARDILGWLVREQRPLFTAREVFLHLRGRYKRMAELWPAFRMLEEHQMIREVAPEHRKTGRPSKTYEASPYVLGAKS